MVIKEVKIPSEDYLSRLAKKVVVLSLGLRLSHTRNCHEINIAINSKNTINKEVTKDQQFAYGQMFKRQREKAERYIKKQKKELIVVGVV